MVTLFGAESRSRTFCHIAKIYDGPMFAEMFIHGSSYSRLRQLSRNEFFYGLEHEGGH